MARKVNAPIRIHGDLREILNFIRVKYIMEGKKPPSMTSITKVMAKKINKEELLEDVFIKF